MRRFENNRKFEPNIQKYKWTETRKARAMAM